MKKRLKTPFGDYLIFENEVFPLDHQKLLLIFLQVFKN